MDQAEFFTKIWSLKKGEAINISQRDMVEVVRREQPSLLFSSPPTNTDISTFINEVSGNCEVDISENIFKDCFCVQKI